jgi:hypothetical protein
LIVAAVRKRLDPLGPPDLSPDGSPVVPFVTTHGDVWELEVSMAQLTI